MKLGILYIQIRNILKEGDWTIRSKLVHDLELNNFENILVILNSNSRNIRKFLV